MLYIFSSSTFFVVLGCFPVGVKNRYVKSTTTSATTANLELELTGPPPLKKKSAMDNLFGDIYITKVEPATKTKVQVSQEEIQNFNALDPVNINTDPLMWWKEKELFLPSLSNIARHLLCIPATSVESERVFSTAGDVVTAQRSALKPSQVDILIFLKKTSLLWER